MDEALGCFIVLDNIPLDARIHLVKDGTVVSPETVRESYARITPLQAIPPKERGWLLDVLRVIRRLEKAEFTNRDVYQYAPELAKLHPENRHVRDKIRQQLQFLRDRRLISQIARGLWALNT